MGNPHAVAFINSPVSEFPLKEIGPKVENNKIFPKRTNFEIARLIGKNEIEVRVWERGVGETLACGTGACAVGVVAKLKGYMDLQIDIIMPGGILKIAWDGKSDVFLTGGAEQVFKGQWKV
jgi:diaminopimelate epimerase